MHEYKRKYYQWLYMMNQNIDNSWTMHTKNANIKDKQTNQTMETLHTT